VVWMVTTKEIAMTDSTGTASLEANLRLGKGVKEQERERVLRRLAGLDARLRSFRTDAVDLLLTVNERETPRQRTTLEATIANWPRLVATSVRAGLDEALAEVGGELVRQLTEVKTRREPAHRHHQSPARRADVPGHGGKRGLERAERWKATLHPVNADEGRSSRRLFRAPAGRRGRSQRSRTPGTGGVFVVGVPDLVGCGLRSSTWGEVPVNG
jgi:ribosome-associated translation inhibitor RaiA